MTEQAMSLKIGIMGGAGEDIPPAYLQKAEHLGQSVADAKCIVITGACPGLRDDVNAQAWVLVAAIVMDSAILAAFLWIKATNDPLVIWVSLGGMIVIFAGERLFLTRENNAETTEPM